MAISNIIARGIGFNPGNTTFIVTGGFSLGAAIIPTFCIKEEIQFNKVDLTLNFNKVDLTLKFNLVCKDA